MNLKPFIEWMDKYLDGHQTDTLLDLVKEAMRNAGAEKGEQEYENLVKELDSGINEKESAKRD